MPAPKGNKYAEGNNGGAPPYFDDSNPEDVKKLSRLCEEYFEYIKGETRDVKVGNEEEGNVEWITETIRDSEPPTVTGLTLHLGFESKTTLYNYAKKQVFLNPIKRALTKIEKYHEIATSMGDKCTGNIFILKNFGWEDKVQQEHSGEIKTTPTLKVEIVKPNEDE